MLSWIFVIGLLIPKLVDANTYDECYFKIKEDFHHEGDVVVGVFFPLNIYYAGKKFPHAYLPHYVKDFYMQ